MSEDNIEMEENGEEDSSPVTEFEWSDEKAEANLEKHGVAFEEAEEAFDDSFAYIFDDEEHWEDETRELLIGYSKRNRLLFISFVQRAPNLIRIISARLADRSERKKYEQEKRF